MKIDCFKAYDIRGQIPNQLNADVAYRIGNATAEYLGAKRIVAGRDIRLSSAELTDAVCRGLTDAGVEVLDIGLLYARTVVKIRSRNGVEISKTLSVVRFSRSSFSGYSNTVNELRVIRSGGRYHDTKIPTRT